MPRTVLKITYNNGELPPHEQSILNTLVFQALCTEEIFSILKSVDTPQREAALKLALEWSITHDLVSDE